MIPLALPSLARTIGIRGGIALAFLLLCAAQTARIEGFLWWDGFKEIIASLRAENGFLRLDLDNIKSAQAEATKRALAEKQTQEARDLKLKEQSDARLEKERGRYRDLAARYAAAHRLRAKGAAASGASGTDLPEACAAAEGTDGACADAEFLAVSRADFDIMVDNTARLVEAVEWAKGLDHE